MLCSASTLIQFRDYGKHQPTTAYSQCGGSWHPTWAVTIASTSNVQASLRLPAGHTLFPNNPLTPDTNRNGCSERETVAFHFKGSIEPRSRVESYIGLGTPAVFVMNMESESPLADVPALRLSYVFGFFLSSNHRV